MAKISGKDGIVKRYSVSVSTASHAAGSIYVTTSSLHKLSAGDRIMISGVVGMTDLNGHWTVATIENSTEFTVVKTTAQTYTSGGTMWAVVEITGWTMDVNSDVSDITDSTNTTWKELQASGYSEATGSFEGFAYAGTNRPAKGESLTFELDMNSTNDYSFTGIITSEGTVLDVPGTDAIKITYNFRSEGSITQGTS